MRKLFDRARNALRRITNIQALGFGVSWQPSPPPSREPPNADVRVTLHGPARDAHFIIQNVGQGTAHDIAFEIIQEEGEESPLLVGDYDQKLPIQILRSGARVEVLAALTHGTGVYFDAAWRWREDDGKVHERSERIHLQSG